jgi:hypothetical protein
VESEDPLTLRASAVEFSFAWLRTLPETVIEGSGFELFRIPADWLFRMALDDPEVLIARAETAELARVITWLVPEPLATTSAPTRP